MKQNLVIIGAGMASGRMLEELFELDRDAYNITLFGAEPVGNYNRIMLSPVLAGDMAFDEIVTHDADWYHEHGVSCRFGETVVKIDRKQKKVISEGGMTHYDKLVIATGSASFIIPVSGNDLPGVIGFRDLADVNKMLVASKKPNSKAVIIGGGLLGLEAAAALNAQGMKVTVLHLMGHLMERQLDPAAGYLLQKELERRGINVVCKAHTKAILGHEHVDAVLMEDGTIHDADIVVMAAGIRPETRIATEAALRVERGIVVDDTMVTTDPDILALGECVEHDGTVYGLVAPLYDMAKVLARTLVNETAKFVAPYVSTKLKVTGVDLFSVGDFAEGDDREEIVFCNPCRGIYKRLILKDNRIIGTVMYGDTTNSSWFFSKIKVSEDISDIRDTLIFGPAFQEGEPLDPLAAVAALPDDAEICGCNGICKSTITNTIKGGAHDLAAIRPPTKASASYNSCSGLVAQVLAVSLDDDFVIPAPQSIYGCTDYTHEDVRRIIKSQHLKSMPAVMNERNYTNIQKDGTYSVLPRTWGRMANWIDIASLGNTPKRGARVLKTHLGYATIFRTHGDQVHAIDDACPLQTGSFDLKTGMAQANKKESVLTYGARMENNRILLDATRLTSKLAA